MRIRTQILLWLLLLVIFPLLGAGLFLFRSNSVLLNTQADEGLRMMVQRVAADTDGFLTRTQEGVLTAAKNPLFLGFLEAGGKLSPGEVTRVERAVMQSIIHDPFMVSSHALIDAKGEKLFESELSLRNQSEAASPWVTACLRTGVPSAVADFGGGRPLLWVCAPVRDGQGVIRGVLRLRYDMAVLQQIVAQYSGDYSRGRHAILVGEDGIIMAHGENEAAVGRLVASEERQLSLLLGEGLDWVDSRLLGGGVAERCRKVALRLRMVPWSVVMMAPERIHHEALRKMGFSMCVLGGLALVLLTVSAVLVSRLLGAPIARLALHASRVGEAGFSGVAEEDGATEVRTLARSFNTMTGRLGALLEELRYRVDELHRSERRLDQYIAAMPVATVVTDPEGRLLHMNRRFTELFGYTMADLPRVEDWWPRAYPDPEYRAEVRAGWERRLSEAPDLGGQVRIIESEITCRDGTRLHIEARGRLIEGALLVTFSDHTERIKAAAEQRMLEDQVRQAQKLEAVGTMAGGVAHDFNNVLLAIMGNAQLALMDTEEGHPARASLNEVLESCARAKELVARILTFTRKGGLKPGRVDLGPVLEETIKLLRASVPASIRVRFTQGEGVPAVECDPMQIHQIVLNLGNNAIHAMRDSGGELAVHLEAMRPGPADLERIRGLRPEHTVCIRVVDTGEGMDEETQAHLFEPYFTTKPMGEGAGLGLATVRSLLKGLGGVVEVRSSRGSGSCFTVHLPGAQSPGLSEGEFPAETRGGSGEGVAVVDDEELVRTMLERMVRRLGYEVTAFPEGSALLRHLREHPRAFRVVVSDLSMPGMGGLELAAEVHKMCPWVPVILATGNSSRLERAQLDAASVADLVDKPFSREELAAVIRRHLDRQPAGT